MYLLRGKRSVNLNLSLAYEGLDQTCHMDEQGPWSGAP